VNTLPIPLGTILPDLFAEQSKLVPHYGWTLPQLWGHKTKTAGNVEQE
jgi:hypothetical protein